VVETHEHPFAVKAIVVAGEMWLTHDGATRHLRPGDRFELAAAAPHAERYGAAAPPTGRRAGTRNAERSVATAGAQAATMSLDWIRLTPALVILSQRRP
jgi:hypothetical protein